MHRHLVLVVRSMFIHIPNTIPRSERRKNILFSIFLFAYGGYGVFVNDLYLPGRHSPGVHLHDVPAWIMYGAMISACLVMISVVVDHYDQRNNERYYRRFAQAGRIVGWGLFATSFLWLVLE
jgi:hypothetical protein